MCRSAVRRRVGVRGRSWHSSCASWCPPKGSMQGVESWIPKAAHGAIGAHPGCHPFQYLFGPANPEPDLEPLRSWSQVSVDVAVDDGLLPSDSEGRSTSHSSKSWWRRRVLGLAVTARSRQGSRSKRRLSSNQAVSARDICTPDLVSSHRRWGTANRTVEGHQAPFTRARTTAH
jgi:hypothetical protein